MRVIFLQNIKGVAQIGDTKNVADGYAKNFLLPKNLAKPATPEALKKVEKIRAQYLAGETTRKENALELAKQFEDMTLEVHEDANEQGHLYGSVDAKKIVATIKTNGITLALDQINLPEHIKSTGEHVVELELHPEVRVKIKVKVMTN